MSTQYTPGPWSMGNQGRFLVCTLTRDVQVYADQMVRTDAVHDARLIASAPELLDIARCILAPDLVDLLPPEYVQRVQAAIAKAEGKS